MRKHVNENTRQVFVFVRASLSVLIQECVIQGQVWWLPAFLCRFTFPASLYLLFHPPFFHLFTLSLPPSFSPCTNPSVPVLFHLSSISLSSLLSSFLPSFHPVSPTPQVPPPLQCSLSRSFMWRCSAGTWSSSLPSCWFTPRLRWAGCCSLCAVWTLRTRQWRWDSSLWLLVCWVSAVVYRSSVEI